MFDTLNGESISALSLRSVVANRLVAAIFRAQITAGSRLVVQKLATQYGISSTPVREAIVFLESVGLVEFEHNRGAVVKSFGPDEVSEIYQVRRVLEVEATRTACGQIPKEELESLREEMSALLAATQKGESWSDRVMACDRRLHQLIASHSSSRRLADEIHRYETLMQTIRQIVGNRRHAQEMGLQEHLAIVDALLQGDAAHSADNMAQHINRTAESATAVMFKGSVKRSTSKEPPSSPAAKLQ